MQGHFVMLGILTMERFELTLTITRKKETVFQDVILVTKPNELCFHYQFKDMVVDGRDLLITSRTSKELLRMDLTTLGG